MRWSTYTPDGRMLEIDHTDGAWVAACDGVRATATSAHEAIRRALDDRTSPIGGAAAALAMWIDEHAAALEREVRPGTA